MNCWMNCTVRSLAHFIGHKRMNSIILVAHEGFSSWVKITAFPLKNLVSSQRRKHTFFSLFLLCCGPPHKANMLLWWKLFATVWQFITHLWASCFFLLLSSLLRHLSSPRWSERTSLNMASICPNSDASLLSQFPSILLLHINSEEDYLPDTCQDV